MTQQMNRINSGIWWWLSGEERYCTDEEGGREEGGREGGGREKRREEGRRREGEREGRGKEGGRDGEMEGWRGREGGSEGKTSSIRLPTCTCVYGHDNITV